MVTSSGSSKKGRASSAEARRRKLSGAPPIETPAVLATLSSPPTLRVPLLSAPVPAVRGYFRQEASRWLFGINDNGDVDHDLATTPTKEQ